MNCFDNFLALELITACENKLLVNARINGNVKSHSFNSKQRKAYKLLTELASKASFVCLFVLCVSVGVFFVLFCFSVLSVI